MDLGGREEAEGAVVIAEPDLGGTGVEIEGHLFRHFFFGISGREDLGADFGGGEEDVGFLGLGELGVGEPSDVGGADAIRGGDRDFMKCLASAKIEIQKPNQFTALETVRE